MVLLLERCERAPKGAWPSRLASAILLVAVLACGSEAPPQDPVGQQIALGQEIFEGKGFCLTCHNGMARYPDLTTMAAEADTRIAGMDGVTYLVQSLYEPDAFITPGFQPGMVAVDQPPFNLTPQEVTAVIAYLQSFTGSPTVTLEQVRATMPPGAASP